MRVTPVLPKVNLGFTANDRDSGNNTRSPVIQMYVNNRLSAPQAETLRAQRLFTPLRVPDIIIQTQRAGSFYLQLYPDTIRKYLSDENGQNAELTQKFISLFTDYVHEIEEEYEFPPEYYEQIGEAGEEVTLILETESEEEERELERELGCSMEDGDRFVNAYMAKVKEQKRQEYADRTYELGFDEIEDISQRAYAFAQGYFALSKTDRGYDFSSFEKKKEILEKVESFETGFNNEILLEVMENARDEDGKLDLELADSILTIMQEADVEVSVKRTADAIKHFFSRDEKHRADILKGFILFNQGTFLFCDEDREFDDMFELCFDNAGRFQKEACMALLELDEEGEIWIGQQEEENNLFPFYKNSIRQVILSYFGVTKDTRTGKFRPMQIRPERFFEMEIEKFFIKQIK